MSPNPLLSNTTLPDFSAIKPSHVEGAVDRLVELVEEQLQQIEKLSANSFDELYAHLDTIGLHCYRIWWPIIHLKSVNNSEENG